ncbi:MAG: endoribonuclease MazF [Chitinivibrionia bacterium]|nr:endoribonuclease MazF [Chitinivibrionia bacterium]
MVINNYIPDRKDIVWLEFSPQSGHEQRGKRPAIVLSPLQYNLKTGLAIFCPITSKIKGYPFEVKIENQRIQGVVLSDQVKSFDWKSRGVQFISKATDYEIESVVSKLSILIGY